jgi:hypothetical protein
MRRNGTQDMYRDGGSERQQDSNEVRWWEGSGAGGVAGWGACCSGRASQDPARQARHVDGRDVG